MNFLQHLAPHKAVFLLYVNNLPDCIKDGLFFMYADGTNVIITAKTILKLLERINPVILDFST